MTPETQHGLWLRDLGGAFHTGRVGRRRGAGEQALSVFAQRSQDNPE